MLRHGKLWQELLSQLAAPTDFAKCARTEKKAESNARDLRELKKVLLHRKVQHALQAAKKYIESRKRGAAYAREIRRVEAT